MKIALIGYGKMGQMIEKVALARGHEIVSIVDLDNVQEIDSPGFASAMSSLSLQDQGLLSVIACVLLVVTRRL